MSNIEIIKHQDIIDYLKTRNVEIVQIYDDDRLKDKHILVKCKSCENTIDIKLSKFKNNNEPEIKCKVCEYNAKLKHALDTAKLYEYKRDFRIQASKEYNFLQKNNKLEEACSHMKKIGDWYHRMIYAYIFDHIDGSKHVYVGLTYDFLKRDEEHRKDENDSVYKHAIEYNLEIPRPIELTDYIYAKEASEMERFYVKKYESEGYKIINKITAGNLGNGILANYNTYDKCKELIDNLPEDYTLSDLMNNEKSLYSAIKRHKWNDLLERFERQRFYYNFTIEDVKEAMIPYSSVTEFSKAQPRMANWCSVNYIRLIDIAPEHYKTRCDLGRENTNKSILCYDKDMNFVKRYNNARETEKDGFRYKAVSQCCRGQRKSHRDHIFKFENEEHNNKWKDEFRPIIRLTKDDEFVKRYDSIEELEADGFNYINVFKVLSSSRKASSGFHFKYAEDETEDIRPILRYSRGGVFIKRYTKVSEIEEDGFLYREVIKVCEGKKKAHRYGVFKYENQ